MSTSIFLGGTVGSTTWRSTFIADLVAAGVPAESIYNPVVPDWTPECQAAEDRAKAEASYNLFYICSPNPGDATNVSVYSIVEAVMGLYDQPSTTVVVFDNREYSGHILKSLKKTEKDLRNRFPNANIFSTYEEAVSYFVARLGNPGRVREALSV
jgi:hypothetical protein